MNTRYHEWTMADRQPGPWRVTFRRSPFISAPSGFGATISQKDCVLVKIKEVL